MKTTKEHFKLFKSECERWISFFGLYGWSVHYEHAAIGDNYGQCVFNITGRVARVTLNTDFTDKKHVVDQVKLTAFHEMCELFLAKLNCLAFGKVASNEDIIDEAIHDIIRTLENKVYKGGIT